MAVVEFDGALELRASRQRTTKNHVRDGNEHDLPGCTAVVPTEPQIFRPGELRHKERRMFCWDVL
jgi:hypothetical protein